MRVKELRESIEFQNLHRHDEILKAFNSGG